MTTDMREALLTFASELNKRMEEKGVTYRQVAFASRVTRGSMVHYKSGNAFPDLYALILMADYLDCRVNDLLGYTEVRDLNVENNSVASNFSNEDEFADYFRLRLHDYMKIKSLNVEELSRRTAISVNTIEMYLSVHRWVPRTFDLICICEALNCTPSELLGC